MGRLLVILALLYGYGHAAWDGQRPDSIDRPLRDFHRATNLAMVDTRRALATLDDARSMRYLATLIRRLDGVL